MPPKKFHKIHFKFFSNSFGIETINTFIHSRSFLEKPYPDHIPDQKWAKSVPVFRPKQHKTIPFWAAHTHIAYLTEYSPSLGVYPQTDKKR